jgi:hypothetical protein
MLPGQPSRPDQTRPVVVVVVAAVVVALRLLEEASPAAQHEAK